ncbi:MAG: hypothetical protein HQ464_02395 [Planctomycetes bacterium]|nr:hypothetical protein [Planctomycetota bacterium]
MRLLLIDHGCCDHDSTRVHRCRSALGLMGIVTAVCGPSSIPQLDEQHSGMFGVHLHAIAAASHRLLAAVRDGSAEALLSVVPTISPRLLGSVRETARQLIAEAVDATDPDVIFVMHAGILTDLAVETGAPVAVHVSASDLTSAAGKQSMRELLTRSLGSCEVIVAADTAAVEALQNGWVDPSPATPFEIWPIEPQCAERIAAACRMALTRRHGSAAG